MESLLTFDLADDELDLFLEDVNERLQSMETGIMRLEQSADPEILQEVFRAAHTLKALAGTVGHHRMAELTHAAETLFDALRSHEVVPTPSLADELLVTVDALKALRDEVTSHQASTIDVGALAARLRRLAQAPQEEATPSTTAEAHPSLAVDPTQLAQMQHYQDEGLALFEIEVQASHESFAPGARLYQAASALGEQGYIVAQEPEFALLSENDQRLRALLASSADADTLREVLGGISELAQITVVPYQPSVPTPDVVPALARESTSDGAIERVIDKTVRISVERLDTLMDLVGELVTSRSRLIQLENTLRTLHGKDGVVGPLGETTAHLGRVIDQLQTEVMRTRMLPIGYLFDKFPRLVRDVARTTHKQINLVIEGEATELDRSIIEEIGDPLIHLLRNAVDHGIESPAERAMRGKPDMGQIHVKAAPVEGQIVITVSDDGQGINPQQVRRVAVQRGLISEEYAAQMSDDEASNLIFLPTLSTATQVTAVSGRGVGLDVVRTNIERLSGSVVIHSEVGRGTTFKISLPLTLAIVQTMLVSIQDAVYAIPLTNMVSALYLSEAAVSTIKGRPAIQWGEVVLPLLDLRTIFDRAPLNHHPTGEPQQGKPAIVIVNWGKLQTGLIVDKIIGQQEVVVKPLSPFIGKVPGLSGSASLGDGRIALIVDIPNLVDTALHARRYDAGTGIGSNSLSQKQAVKET